MASKTTSVRINQTLHGYNDGHTLLASSVELAPEVKRLLLIMSDMSGPSMQPGFEEYFSGYPIRELNAYALAKTWYAPEMKRPGCVWTQTFLLNFSDLVHIDDLEEIIKLFERPLQGSIDKKYEKAIDVQLTRNLDDETFIQETNDVTVKELIDSLYTKTKYSIVIKSRNSLRQEGLILSIWQQQWPRLKRNFTFCTGSISLRFFNSKILDLQVMPERGDNNIYSINNIHIIDEKESYKRKDFEPWVETAYNDLKYRSDVRRFLKIFGIDVKGDRSSFKPLVEIFCFLKTEYSSTADRILELLSKYYPSSSDASYLKVAFLGSGSGAELWHFSEQELLMALSKTKNFKSFDYNKLDFEGRFKRLFFSKSTDAYDIINNIITTEANPYGEEIIKSIALQADISSLRDLPFNFKNLILVFITLNPRLAYNESIWKNGPINQKELIAALLKNPTPNVDWQEIINILISLDADIDPELIAKEDIPIVSYVLNWINNKGTTNLHYRWLSLIEKHPEEVVDWINTHTQINSWVLLLILQYLNPNSKLIINNGSKIWLQLISNFKDAKGKLIIQLNSFALALAFNNPDQNSSKLARESFEVVYNAAAKDELDFNLWNHIEVHTKPLHFWNDWDKCKKLLLALIEKSESFKWDLNYYTEHFANLNIGKKLEKLRKASAKR